MKYRLLSILSGMLLWLGLLTTTVQAGVLSSGSVNLPLAAMDAMATPSATVAPDEATAAATMMPAETAAIPDGVVPEVPVPDTVAPDIAESPEVVAEEALEIADEATDLLKQLETDILPQIASVLTPEQQAQFATKVADGTSFRKAFKAVVLTPAQKSQLATVLKSMPKKDIFATLTPAQKKQLFLNNKEFFIPTPAEIGAKITAGMNMAKNKSPKSAFAPTPEAIAEKISAKMTAKMAGKPTMSRPGE